MKVTVKTVGDCLWFGFQGELDESAAAFVRSEMDRMLETKKYSHVGLDFADMPFMDSTGIGVIIGRYKKLQPSGKNIYVKNANRQVDKILTASGLYKILKKVEK